MVNKKFQLYKLIKVKININDDKELYRNKPEEKLGILEINEREKVDIEIQLVDRSNIQERLLYYFSKICSNEINRGDEYKKAKSSKCSGYNLWKDNNQRAIFKKLAERSKKDGKGASVNT